MAIPGTNGYIHGTKNKLAGALSALAPICAEIEIIIEAINMLAKVPSCEKYIAAHWEMQPVIPL